MAEAKSPASASKAPGNNTTSKTITNNPSGAGTVQREPRAEDLPPDAKIAPIAEQINPNANALAVGAIESEDSGEGKKIVDSDMSNATEFLPEGSKQIDAAKRAEGTAKLRADEA